MIPIYTNKFVLPWAAGTTYGPLILIKPEYKDDKGILVHEQEHVKQWAMWLMPGSVISKALAIVEEPLWWIPLILSSALHGLLYKLCKPYRLSCELAAYAMQIRAGTITPEGAAYYLSNRYDFTMIYNEALGLIHQELRK